jgi:hypothetical protein
MKCSRIQLRTATDTSHKIPGNPNFHLLCEFIAARQWHKLNHQRVRTSVSDFFIFDHKGGIIPVGKLK